MILSFANVEVDPATGMVRRGGELVHVPARVPRLLQLLALNADRVVSKDEIVSELWQGRAITENALTTLIKDARKAVGDDGLRQNIIRTQYGVGFQLVQPVRFNTPEEYPAIVAQIGTRKAPGLAKLLGGKPSVAVLRFSQLSGTDDTDFLVQAIPAEIIAALSKLRSVSVTSRQSSLRFEKEEPKKVGQILGVRYCVIGGLEVSKNEIGIAVELVRCTDDVVIWADRLQGAVDDVHDMRARIVAAVVNAFDLHLPMSEADAAQLRPPECLDAWAEFHIGLQHLYRFNFKDNERAKHRFSRAIAMERGFARAHAGLAFSWFQTAFLGGAANNREAIHQATAYAMRALELDKLDPFASYCMGRTYWVGGDLEAAQSWMRRSTELCPNYAQAHYAHALMSALQGEGYAAGRENELAMALSPLDPLRYAMLGTQCHIAINELDYAVAADWADQAALCPGSHYLLGMLASAANQLNGDRRRARHWHAKVKAERPDASVSRFFGAFPYPDIPERQRIETALLGAGFSR